MPLDETLKAVSNKLGLEEELLRELIDRRTIRYMDYHGINYLVFRREWRKFREGTTILEKNGEVKVVHGYPSIQRILLLKAIPRHFIDNVIVEEKLDGYNVRVVLFADQILAITRGGYICPYTTARIRALYEEFLKKLFKKYGEDLIVCGEVIGTENPYVQHYYPEAPTFDYFVFDIMRDKHFIPIDERNEIIDNVGLKRVRRLGVIDKDDIDTVRSIVGKLEREEREGIVLKDPKHRVKALKYTTSHTHFHDLELGMKYPFDEGRGFLFSRILREVWKIYEENLSDEELEERAKKLGLAILKPAIDSIKLIEEGRAVYEEYVIRVPSIKVLDEFMDYMDKLGVHIALAQVTTLENGVVKARIIKMKETDLEYRRILRTGYSPLD